MADLRSRRVCAAVAIAALSLALVLASPVAEARSTFDSAYGFDRTFNAAVRLVRVDMGLKITEKDDKGGYFVFDYRSTESGNKVTSGSIECVRSPDPSAPVRVVVQLPQMPRAHEQVLVDSLVRKMREDYGDPPERPKTPPASPQPPPDGGVEAGDDAS